MNTLGQMHHRRIISVRGSICALSSSLLSPGWVLSAEIVWSDGKRNKGTRAPADSGGRPFG